jgi:hypothetical protein
MELGCQMRMVCTHGHHMIEAYGYRLGGLVRRGVEPPCSPRFRRRLRIRRTKQCLRAIPRDQTLPWVPFAFDGRQGILIDDDGRSPHTEANRLEARRH